MSDIITLTNFSQVWMGSYTNTIEEHNLKSLCLYNDKVILTISDWMFKGFISGMEKEGINSKLLIETFISLDEVSNGLSDTVFDHTISPSKLLGEALDNESTNELLKTMADREGLTLKELENKYSKDSTLAYAYYKEAYYQKLSVLSALLMYNKVNSITPCSLTTFSSAESFVVNSFIKYNSKKDNDDNINIDELTSEVNCLLPSISSLSWNEIFEIRQDKRIKSFRTWINDNKTIIEEKGMNNKINEELWKVFTELKPNLLTNSLKATLGNIPLPIPINPLGVASSILDIARDIKFKRKYAWLLFIHDTRDKAITAANKSIAASGAGHSNIS